ncbi:MAG: hypothetical protein J6X33_01590 [Clostridiales bacterium]|nr:hypothetical protein [Clostridiales bacterium]
MMTRAGIRRFVLETGIVMLVAAIIVFGGYLVSRHMANERLQEEYIRDFTPVLSAVSYEPLHTAILRDYPDIKSCYLGYDDSHNIAGYVIDIVSDGDNGSSIHLLVGIDYENSQITGIRHVYDEENPMISDEVAFEAVRDSLVGSIIPVALSEQGDEGTEDDNSSVSSLELRNGIYYAQSMTADKDGYIDFVEIEVSRGVITRIQWDAFNIDPTTKLRSISSLSGAYTVSGENWATQSYNVCHAMLELQSPEKLAMKSDGTTQLVKGVTCNIRKFVELAKECIDNSKAGFNKEEYFSALDGIVSRVKGKPAEEAGIINEDGYIVISFDDKPEIFTLYKDDAEGNKKAYATIGVRLIEQQQEQKDEAKDDKNEGQDKNNNDGKDEPDATPTPQDNDTEPSVNADPGEDGKSSDKDKDSDLVGSVDDLPLSEISTFVDAPQGYYREVRYTARCLNTCYKFLKDYLNWLV